MSQPTYLDEIYEILALVPEGRVTTYGHIAEAIGSKKSARIVGWAMNRVHSVDPSLPAHRVVNRNGVLTGKHHFGDPDRMQKLLEKEGIRVENEKIMDFQNLLWIPLEELKI